MIRLVKTRLWLQILIAMLLGLACGLLLLPDDGALVSKDLSLALADWLKLPGAIF